MRCKLGAKIDIEEFSTSTDGMGTKTKTWATLTGGGNLWAGVRHHFSAGEKLEAQQEVAQAFTEFTIRYLSTVSAKMRVVHDGRNYSIEALKPMPGERPRFLVIKATRRDDG